MMLDLPSKSIFLIFLSIWLKTTKGNLNLSVTMIVLPGQSDLYAHDCLCAYDLRNTAWDRLESEGKHPKQNEVRPLILLHFYKKQE